MRTVYRGLLGCQRTGRGVILLCIMSESAHKALPLPLRIIDQPDELARAMPDMTGSPLIALDTESNSLHHYPEQLCLLQVATTQAIYVIDTIAIKTLASFEEVLFNDAVIKIIHGADYDVRSLSRYGGLRVRNIYDTYIAARFAGIPRVGLADLLKDLLGVSITKSKQLQHADWGRRPLSAEAIEYAATDVQYLFPLRENLDKRLQALGRASWVAEECSRLQEVRYTPPAAETAYLGIKGAQHLDGQGLAVLKKLYVVREEEALRLHRPPFFIMPDNTLVYLASNPAANPAEIPGLNQNGGQRLQQNLRQALRDGQNSPPIERQRAAFEPLRPEQAQLLTRLKAWREAIALKLALDPSLLWPTPSLERLAKAPDSLQSELVSPSIRRWQRAEFAPSLEAQLKTGV